MIKGIQTAAMGMNVQMIKQNVIANNLANADTTGFKREMALFQQADIQYPVVPGGCPTCTTSPDSSCCGNSSQENTAALDVIYKKRSPIMSETYTVFENGGLKPTQNPLDVGIEGDAFFSVQTPLGVRYTRSGSFTMNTEGVMVNQSGYEVQGTNGPINIAGKNIAIGSDGTISVDGEVRGQLSLTSFADKRQLQKSGDNLFIASDNAEQTELQNVSVAQGFLETSNVNAIREMVDMITAYRSYEANQRSITAQDTTLGLAVNDVGQA